jgi:hypothetical protein
MAIEWRDVCLKSLLADGKVDEPEIKVLKSEFKTSGGHLSQEGATFLRDLRLAYTKKAKAKKEDLTDAFENYFFAAMKAYVLQDGEISEHEAQWLRANLFADNKIDDREWKFLQDLKKKATKTSNAFIQLYADCEKKRGGAAKAAPAKKKGS